MLVGQNQWAADLRKADERCEHFTQVIDELQQKIIEEQQFSNDLSDKIKVRDEEILRLHDLYTPAQNLEKVNLKYQYEQNEKAVKNLQNQVDFLNRENEQLMRHVEILKGDGEGNLALAQYKALNDEI